MRRASKSKHLSVPKMFNLFLDGSSVLVLILLDKGESMYNDSPPGIGESALHVR